MLTFSKTKIFWEVASSEWSRSQGHLELPEWRCGSVLKPLEMPIELLSLSLEAMTIKSGNKSQRNLISIHIYIYFENVTISQSSIDVIARITG